MALPVTIEVKEENGKMTRVHLPAEVWQRGGTWTFAYKSSSKIAYAMIDPDHVLPDVDPENNALSGLDMDKNITAATIVKSYFDAIGGKEKVKDIKDLTINSEGEIQGFKFVRVNKFKVPGEFFQDITVPNYNNFAVSHIVIKGDSILLRSNDRPQKLSATEAGAVKARYKLFPELDFDKAGYTVTLDDKYNIIKGSLAYQLTVKGPDGLSVKYFYDAKTGLKVKQYTDVANATHMEFSDYRTINTGVKIPFSELNSVNGNPIQFEIKSASANTGLLEDSFQ